ncbi:unnamed protein product [Toxocara canis]|uniref:Nudix hydrolase domain-containing protein n=1 Tax=Toxocara canis TaxID=6265 RepID=A0A183U0M7_TOXCA|nr:unnamed protein product [Toxocara canis]
MVDRSKYATFLQCIFVSLNPSLLEESETVSDAARRELKEETGYTASKVTCLSETRHPLAAQITDNSVCYALAEIDGDSIENQSPTLSLDEAEIIEVVEVECCKALSYVHSLSTDIHVDGMVYAFLLGYTASP